jgi:hypothetical protein
MFGFSILPISTQFLPPFNGVTENLVLYIDQEYSKNLLIDKIISFVFTIDQSKAAILS